MMKFEDRRKMSAGLVLMTLSVFLFSACSKSSSPDEVASLAQAPTPPAGGGAFTISASGGNGTNGNGSLGGNVRISSTDDLRILNEDAPFDTTFTLPTDTPSLGANPRTITVTGNVLFDNGLPTCPPGTTILGDDILTPATGLKVAAGVTATFVPDPQCFGVIGILDFPGDVVIEGTVTSLAAVAPAAPSRVAIIFHAGGNFFGIAGSTINNAGFDSALGNAGNGGSFTVLADGKIVSAGTIVTTGGKATGTIALGTDGDGGNGGAVAFQSSHDLYSAGDISTFGGSSAGGNGGDGRSIQLLADLALPVGGCGGLGGIGLSGTLNASGADGLTLGGAAGNIIANATSCSNHGDLMSSATILGNGGSATDGNGGAGSQVSLNARGLFAHKGEVSVNGGSGAEIPATLPPITALGGDAGLILINNNPVLPDDEDPDKGTWVTGNLSANAGAGEIAGGPFGGGNAIDINGNREPTHLVNYSSINNPGGGSALGTAGAGGTTAIGISRDLRTEIDFNNPGGIATGPGSRGGNGGVTTLAANLLIVFGDFDNNAGSGFANGANGGIINVTALNGGFIQGTAGLVGSGPTDLNSLSVGGAGGFFNTASPRTFEANMAIDVSGASALNKGGNAGGVSLTARNHLTTTGALTGNGGSTRSVAPFLLFSGPGDGGFFNINTDAEPSISSGLITANKGGGGGAIPAEDGEILIDGFSALP